MASVLITYDPQKRAETLSNRGFDFEHAPRVFSGDFYEVVDDRRDYGEVRWQTVGWLNEVMVMVVWTPRGDARHIISMRKCNERERRRYLEQLGRS
jgi:uncharacterized DUF497 family protein